MIEDQRRLFEDFKFYTPSGKAQFIFEDAMTPPVQTSKEYPYLLNTGRATAGQWHTLTRTREIPAVQAITPSRAYICIHPILAAKLKVKDSDFVRVHSSNGQSREFLVRVSDTVQENHLFAPMHYPEANALLTSIFDPYSKEPSYKMTAVQIEKCCKEEENHD